MSHFPVWVFTESGTETEIDDLLSPYYEGVEVEPYIDRRREDIVPEYRTRWNEYLARAEQDLLKAVPEDRPSVLGRISKIRTALARSDEEIYRAETDGEELDAEGNILSTYNPDSKWDWYTIGGRFENTIRTRDGRMVTSCPVSDIAPDADPDKLAQARRRYGIITGEIPPVSEKEKRLAEDRIARFEMCFYQDADDFAYQACANGAYAVVLPNGVWQEPGKMGWWGVSSASKDARREWNHSFADQFIRNMPSNRIVTVVDCHI